MLDQMILLATELAKDAAELAVGIGGIAGSIIGVLMGVVALETGAIIFMQKRADKVYGYRLGERDTLKDSLHEASVAIAAQAAATKERNALLEDLARTIQEQTRAHVLLVERLTLQHSHLSDSQEKTEQVITSIANAMRDAALQTSGVKQLLESFLLQGLPGITRDMETAIAKGLQEVRDATRNSRSR